LRSKFSIFEKESLTPQGAVRTVIARFGRSGAAAARDWLYDFGGAKNGQSELAGGGDLASDFGAILEGSERV
jgi:hypothetical protein